MFIYGEHECISYIPYIAVKFACLNVYLIWYSVSVIHCGIMCHFWSTL